MVVAFLMVVAGLACNLTKKEALAQVFSSEFCEISKNTFLQNWVMVTVIAKNGQKLHESQRF